MKLFLYLFSLYILVLAGIPCQADDDCCIDEIALHPPAGKTEKHPGYPAPCSPFFACGACHGFVVPQLVLPVPGHQLVQPVRQAFYKGEPLPDFDSSIWQPPRVNMA